MYQNNYQASQQPQVVPIEPILQQILEEMDAVCERIQNVSCNLSNAADRLCGAQPEPATKQNDLPPIGCAIERLQQIRAALSIACSKLEDTAARFSSTV